MTSHLALEAPVIVPNVGIADSNMEPATALQRKSPTLHTNSVVRELSQERAAASFGSSGTYRGQPPDTMVSRERAGWPNRIR